MDEEREIEGRDAIGGLGFFGWLLLLLPRPPKASTSHTFGLTAHPPHSLSLYFGAEKRCGEEKVWGRRDDQQQVLQ